MPLPAEIEVANVALVTALDDEYRARATYQAVIDAHGPLFPFINIVRSEERHIAALISLFHRYGLPLPPDRWSGRVTAPPTPLAACEAGVVGEVDNYRMYDTLLEQVTLPEVRTVFANLRNASAFHHLPAFQSCAGQPLTSGSIPPAVAAEPVAGGRAATPLGRSGNLLLGVALGAGLVWWLSRRRAVA